jgi:hypothetical protein
MVYLHLRCPGDTGILPSMEANSVSPDGKYKLETDSIEFRMSHWVDRPRVSDLQTGEMILDLAGTEWDVMNFVWKEEGRLWLELRRYPGDCESISLYLHLAERKITCGFFKSEAKNVLRPLNKFYREHRQPA